MKIFHLIFALLFLVVSFKTAPKAADKKKVIHTVLFKFTSHTTQGQIEQLLQNAKDLKDKIPGILDMTYGKNFSERAKNYSYAITMTLSNTEALTKFYSHPAHLELVNNFIKPISPEIIVVDYENSVNQ